MVTSALRQSSVRDSEAMRERILAAVGRMVLRDGLAGVGVNALAREVGCDKVLIYRYFGDLDGVYAAYAARSDFWWTLEELTAGLAPEALSLAAAVKLLIRRHAEVLRARPTTLAIMAAECIARTPLVVALEDIRERRALALTQWIAARYRVPQGADIEAIALILGMAVNYLAIRARAVRVMSGVPIATDTDWARLLAAIDVLVDGALSPG